MVLPAGGGSVAGRRHAVILDEKKASTNQACGDYGRVRLAGRAGAGEKKWAEVWETF